MIEIDKRMELRLNALISLKKAILPGFCKGIRCDESCPLYKDNIGCYWMDALNKIDVLERILCGYGVKIPDRLEPKPSTKEQSRFEGII